MQNPEKSEAVYQYTGSLKVVLGTKLRNTVPNWSEKEVCKEYIETLGFGYVS